MRYHIPVMLNQCIQALAIQPSGIYVDLTFGGGGHSREILKHLDSGKLYAFDQDDEAASQAENIKDDSFSFIKANFRFLKRYLRLHGIKTVDGILADLGVSSHQIDSAERGFSTRFDAALDMRMDQEGETSAYTVINEYSEKDLHRILGLYGEVRNAKTLAAAIVKARINNPIESIDSFKEVLNVLAPRHREFKYYAQVFQAIRIEVNDEMAALKEMLEQCADLLSENGRLVVMSYHSLEDRMVKNIMNKGLIHGELEKDVYGNVDKPFHAINRKPILPEEKEIEVNNRARSAKLRVAEKI